MELLRHLKTNKEALAAEENVKRAVKKTKEEKSQYLLSIVTLFDG